ncbi:MAG: outer membrane beta-barrel family protein, partial [Bacteroidota bacterium]
NDKHSIGGSFSSVYSTNDRSFINTTDILYDDSRPDNRLVTENVLDRSLRYFSTTGYYEFKIDTMGQKLDVDFNYTSFDRDNTSTLFTENIAGEDLGFSDQRNEQPGTTEIYVAQLDYTKPFSKAVTLQAGGRYSSASLDNDLRVFNFENPDWNLNTLQSNRFLFDETITAAYAKLNLKTDDWEITAGLRYEDSRSTGYSVTLDSTNVRDIRRFFPSASVSRNIVGDLGAALAYSYRIQRPSYSDLNPFVMFLDPLTSERGNPFLRPELTHSAKLSLTYEKQPFFNLEYNRTNNFMALVTEQNDA